MSTKWSLALSIIPKLVSNLQYNIHFKLIHLNGDFCAIHLQCLPKWWILWHFKVQDFSSSVYYYVFTIVRCLWESLDTNLCILPKTFAQCCTLSAGYEPIARLQCCGACPHFHCSLRSIAHSSRFKSSFSPGSPPVHFVSLLPCNKKPTKV